MLKNRLYRYRPLVVTMSVVIGLIMVFFTVARVSAATVPPIVAADPQAELVLTMTDTPDPVNAGGTLTYTLLTENVGVFDAGNVVLTDTLPATVTLQTATTTQGTCTATAQILPDQIVRCVLGDINSGEDATVTIRVTPNQPGTITNRAIVSTDFDPDPTNNDAETTTTVLGVADVGVVIDGTPDVVNIGDPLTFTVSITNDGPNSGNNIHSITTLPSQVDLESVTSSQGTCTGTTTIDCTIGTLVDEAGAQVTIVVIPDSEGVITTSTSVVTQDNDQNNSNNQSSETTTVRAAADIGVEKTVNPANGVEGDVFAYQVRVYNNGPQRADNVVMTDTLPSGLTIQNVSTTQGTCSQNGNTVRCTLNSIPDDADVRVTVNARADQAGTFTNTARATTSDFDFNPSNNEDEAQIVVAERKADLAVTMSATPPSGNVGDSFTYHVEVRNDGPQEAEATRMTITLPSGVTLQNVTASQGGCLGSPNLVCEFGAINEDQTVTVDVQVRADIAGTLTATSTAGSLTADPNESNNTASANISVQGVAELSVTMSDAPDPVGIGSELRYTMTVRNDGPQAASVTLTDTLPAQVNFVSAVATTGSCTGDATVVCNLGALEDGQEAFVVIVVRPTALGTITNTAVVDSDVFDPNTGNNSASAQTTVQVGKIYMPLVFGAPSCTTLEVEPNNTADEALNHLPLCRADTLHGTVPEGDSSDIYVIRIESTTTVTIRLSDIPSGNDYDLFLYNEDRDQIAESRNVGDADEEITIPLTPGTYFVRVLAFGDQRSNEPYALRWE